MIIYVNNETMAVETIMSGGLDWLDVARAAMAEFDQRPDWLWLGQQPNENQMLSKVIDLGFSAQRAAERRRYGDAYAGISTGRLHCSATYYADRTALQFSMHYPLEAVTAPIMSAPVEIGDFTGQYERLEELGPRDDLRTQIDNAQESVEEQLAAERETWLT